MLPKAIRILVILMLLTSCVSKQPSTKSIGKFQVQTDLFLAQFDCKTDVDDIQSVAGVVTMLADPRFLGVRYHAVAGAYGIQEGLYVPGNPLFEAAFDHDWSDAHTNYEHALREVTIRVTQTLENGGNIWIADAGQSDFTADIIRNIRKTLPSIQTKRRIHVVQHSEWNENSAAPDNLSYVKTNAAYHKIPDGNIIGNGSPGFYTPEVVNWRDYIKSPKLVHIWEMAIEIANQYNGKDGRHNNPAIADGGLDFSDVSETCWIFGFSDLKNAEQFFKEFSSISDS